MRKTAKLLLLMVLLFITIPCFQSASSGETIATTEGTNTKYRQYTEIVETMRRKKVEDVMYLELINKPSLKWVITGFVEAQQFRESSGKQSAVSPKGAIGLAQFMPGTWDFLITRGLIPWWFNIHNERHQEIAQLVYLNYLYELFDEVAGKERKTLTIAAYNAGPTRVRGLVKDYGKAWKQELPAETKLYLTHLKEFI